MLALTANPYYMLDGVTPGTRLTTAAHRLTLGPPMHCGPDPNTWYAIPGQTSNGVLKVRHHVISEVGIANQQLTHDRAAELQLPRRF